MKVPVSINCKDVTSKLHTIRIFIVIGMHIGSCRVCRYVYDLHIKYLVCNLIVLYDISVLLVVISMLCNLVTR
jgi:hypothetical protein